MSSACFEPKGLPLGRQLYMQLWYGTFYINQYKLSSRWKGVFDIFDTLPPTRLLIKCV